MAELRTWRELRRKRREREAMLLDLGALVHELHRQGRRAPELLQEKATELGEVDRELRELEAAAGGAGRGVAGDGSCPGCGEPVEPRQLVCLNCGGRVALREQTILAMEPVTLAAAVLLAVIVIGAGLFGFAISELTSGGGGGEGDAGEPSVQRVAAGPAVVAGEEQPAERSPEDAGAVPGWPAGVSAHTVVLVTSSDRAAALGVAKEARGTGLEAGLIRSEPYGLGTGLWIVFSGRFTTPEGAERQAAQLAGRYPGAYPQLVQRSQ